MKIFRHVIINLNNSGKLLFVGVCLLFSTLLFPATGSAETVVRVGDGITVDADQVVAGDYYVSVGIGNTSMSGTVEGDMYALGSSVTVNGVVQEDLTYIAGVSQLHASITDDVRTIAGEVVVAEYVGGDLFVIGNTLKVLSSAEIAGNVYFFGSDAVIEGAVGGSVFGRSNRLRIDGPIGGNVDVTVVHGLTLGSKASIGGDINYKSSFEVVRAPEVVIEGELTQVTEPTPSRQEVLRAVLIPIFVTLFATLSLYLLFRREIVAVVNRAHGRYLKLSLVGLAAMIVAPIVSVLLMVTVLGSLLGIILLSVTGFVLFCGYALTSVVCGSYLARSFNAQEPVSLVWIMVGVLAIAGVTMVPIVGPIIAVAIYSISIGMLTERIYQLFT